MVRGYAHMSVKHLAPYAARLAFPDASTGDVGAMAWCSILPPELT